MSVETEVLILRRLPLFRCIADDQLRLVVFGSERVRLREGRELYRENQPADCAYIVLNGQIDLFHPSDVTSEMKSERPVVLRSLTPGAMIGEMALFSRTKRPTSAVAAYESEVLRVSRGIFRRILDEYPDIAKRIYHYLNADFRAMVERMGYSFGKHLGSDM